METPKIKKLILDDGGVISVDKRIGITQGGFMVEKFDNEVFIIPTTKISFIVMDYGSPEAVNQLFFEAGNEGTEAKDR